MEIEGTQPELETVQVVVHLCREDFEKAFVASGLVNKSVEQWISDLVNMALKP